MNHVNSLSANVELTQKQNSHHVIFPDNEKYNLIDIELKIYTFPIWTQRRTTRLKLDEADNINLYLRFLNDENILESENITEQVLFTLMEQVKTDLDIYKNQFVTCLNNLIQKQKRNGYDGEYINISKVEKFILELNQDPSLLQNYFFENKENNDNKSKVIFGNNKVYHLSNFLFWGVNLPSISLKPILDILEIKPAKVKGMVFSAGRDPLYDKKFDGYGSGGIHYEIALINKNPLDSQLNEILTWITNVSSILDEIIASTDDLHQNREVIIEELKGLSIKSNDLDSELKNIAQRIEQVLINN